MSISEFLRKTFAHQESRVRQAGQAILEYILMLVITVAIILGAMSQFSDAFKQFLDSYFGEYIACLLETGELPAFGGSGAGSGECNAQFQTFTIANGRPRINSSNGGSGSGSSGSGAGSGRGAGPGEDGSGNSGSSGRNRGLRPARFTRGGGVGNADSSSLSSRLRPGTQSANNTGNNSNANSASPGGDADSTDGGFGGNRRRSRRYRTRVITLGEEYVTEDAKEKAKKTVTRSAKSKEQKLQEELRAAKFELEVPEKRTVATEEKTSGFSFGAMIKILLIAGIVIAIFIFLGGQALQIKKSWQKTE